MINLETPVIWIFACAIFACALTGILYWNIKSLDLSKKMIIILYTIRSLALFFILILLLNIFFVKHISNTTKPLVICAVDNSESMILAKDSTDIKIFFKNDFSSIKSSLQKDFTTKNISFGKETIENDIVTFNKNTTNLSSVFSYIDNYYDKTDVNAAILFTDGIYNYGPDPSIFAQTLTYPIYIIATGDTTSKADIAITNIRYNKTTYLQGKCVFEINVKATGFNNTDAIMQITDNGQIIMTKNIHIDNNPYYSSFNIDFEPKTIGKHFYKFNILAPNNDCISQNNEQTCVVKVIEGKKNLIMISNGAHPDIGAIYSAISQSDYLNIQTYLLNQLDINKITDNDILILSNLPDASSKSKLLFDKINQYNLPYLSIVGAKTDINTFNTVNNNIKINNSNNTFQEAYPTYNNNFKTFSIDNNNIDIYQYFTPLISPFGVYDIPQYSEVLFYQKIGNVNTKIPLIISAKDYNQRRVFIFGEGVWQWRIRNYINEENYSAFDEIFNSFVYYLSLSETFKHFQVNIENEYFQDEKIIIGAELYDDNYKLYNTPDIQMVIKDENNNEFPFYFTKTDNSKYTLDIDNFPSGQYTWKASTLNESLEGAFYISPSDPEYNDLQARHDDLKKIADITGGKMILLKDANDIHDILKKTIKRGKTFSFQEHHKLKDYLPVLIFILGLLSLEWAIRRRHGIY